MKSKAAFLALAVVGTLIAAAQAQTAPDKTIPVTVENFIRAESDLYLSVVALKEVVSASSSTIANYRPSMPKPSSG